MRIGIKERSRKGRFFYLGFVGFLVLGVFLNYVFVRGCVIRIELIIFVIYMLGWGLLLGGRRGYFNILGRM